MIEIMPNPTMTSHGNYRCEYCPKTWKRWDNEFIHNHYDVYHKEEALQEAHAREVSALEIRNKQLVEENRQLKAPKKVPKQVYYNALWFCTNCRQVQRAGLPKGVLIENVVHSNCGMKGTIMLASNDTGWSI